MTSIATVGVGGKVNRGSVAMAMICVGWGCTKLLWLSRLGYALDGYDVGPLVLPGLVYMLEGFDSRLL